MTTYVSAELRRLVATRSKRLCEYCLIHEDDTHFGCQVEHIIAEKHGGVTEAGNLAYACAFCNRAKGTDIGSTVPETGTFIRFFNPRLDRWSDHFRLSGVHICPKTEIGSATAKILRFNSADRIHERLVLQGVQRYPPVEASEMIDVD